MKRVSYLLQLLSFFVCLSHFVILGKHLLKNIFGGMLFYMKNVWRLTLNVCFKDWIKFDETRLVWFFYRVVETEYHETKKCRTFLCTGVENIWQLSLIFLLFVRQFARYQYFLGMLFYMKNVWWLSSICLFYRLNRAWWSTSSLIFFIVKWVSWNWSVGGSCVLEWKFDEIVLLPVPASSTLSKVV